MMSRERTSASSVTSRKEWLTQRELLELFKDEGIVQQVVAVKRANGESRADISVLGTWVM